MSILQRRFPIANIASIFCKIEEKTAAYVGTGDMPLKPTAILNFKKIDNTLADIVVNFWNLTWGKEKPAIDQKTIPLLSLANGVGARSFVRQPVNW